LFGAWLLPAIAVIAFGTVPAVAADRIVVCEEFGRVT
jgi:hypothetical protein